MISLALGVRYGATVQVLLNILMKKPLERKMSIYILRNAKESLLERKSKSKWWIFLIAIGGVVAVFICCCLCLVIWTKYKAKVDKTVKLGKLIWEIGGRSTADIHIFSFKSVASATNNFSVENKLGEGGYRPVYKGTLPDGQEIVVKKLSKRSGQGLQEFKNEAKLIAKLQHTNLVRLFSFCVEQEERILIYEYMRNKSLDSSLFEYAMNGIVSTKADVFSFGVLVLEIVSGKKNNSCYHSEHPLNLIGLAWKLWTEGKSVEIIEPSILESCPTNEVLGCIQLGLLCVQDHTADRSSMLEVDTLPSNETVLSNESKQPAYFIDQSNGSIEEQRTCSVNEVTISDMDVR